MTQLRIGKSEKERREVAAMAAAVAAYTGPVHHLPAGVARGHEPLTSLLPNRANVAALRSAAIERREPTGASVSVA
jgi:hypothetical protein